MPALLVTGHINPPLSALDAQVYNSHLIGLKDNNNKLKFRIIFSYTCKVC